MQLDISLCCWAAAMGHAHHSGIPVSQRGCPLGYYNDTKSSRQREGKCDTLDSSPNLKCIQKYTLIKNNLYTVHNQEAQNLGNHKKGTAKVKLPK